MAGLRTKDLAEREMKRGVLEKQENLRTLFICTYWGTINPNECRSKRKEYDSFIGVLVAGNTF